MSNPSLDTASGIISALITTPRCHGMEESSVAATERANLMKWIQAKATGGGSGFDVKELSPLQFHLAQGLALTIGSALGSEAPPIEGCRAAFEATNRAGLGVGARAWSKHAHRSRVLRGGQEKQEGLGWWGRPSGPVSVINENALKLFWRIMDHTTWRNLHWLPHKILVYEVRVEAGYGMRWYQDQGQCEDGARVEDIPWTFRGFVEPMMENGHELGWRHVVAELPPSDQ
ncbi:hypothetical protein AX16_000767 [Volvariella volvacea WC 439]|nr:hypothetical protein AX16_000767 [Volvariella volvacea WC 439]